MANNKIDLHTHSCKSDGEKTPEELLKQAQEKKIEYLSITDHGNCLAYVELEKIKVNEIYTGKLICGCELATIYQNVCIEILGYGVDYRKINQWFEKEYSKENVLKRDETLYQEALEKIKKIGLVVKEKMEFTQEYPYEGYFKKYLYESLEDNERNKKYLLENGIQTYEQFLRNGLYCKKSPLHINMAIAMPKIEQIIELIHEAGGLAFLAHLYQYGISDPITFLKELKKETKIDGIEAYYSTFKEEQKNTILEFCTHNNLYVSGGSDYHGKAKPAISLADGLGSLMVDEKEIKKWINKVGVYQNGK